MPSEVYLRHGVGLGETAKEVEKKTANIRQTRHLATTFLGKFSNAEFSREFICTLCI